jgi:phosphoribosylamine--glycine ligase
MDEVIRPTVRGMAEDGKPYTGFLYAGIMVAADGTPKVLEYNVRFGDPETQPIMLRLKSDLVALCEAALDGRLDETTVEWDTRSSLGVVLAAGGYPGSYRKGDVIRGLEAVSGDDVKVFHAGTVLRGDTVVTSGGRVLCVCALGEDVAQAQRKAYAAVELIRWDDMYCRRDIGHRAIDR